MANFFVHRPVFAWVLAIIVMLVGGFGYVSLPVSQYPEVSPTTVRISASYTGASADIVANSVTTVIEDGMTGLDGLTYMTSSSTDGSSSISLVFDSSVDPDMAQVQVQNKLQLVQSTLPSNVQQNGVSVTRSTSSILMVGALVSKDGSRSSVELGDIFKNRIEDSIKRLQGVGDINEFGTQYAMRIWLDPDKLNQYGLTANDVTDAVTDQNTNVTVGSLGDLPAVKGHEYTMTLRAQSQLSTVEEFRNILLKTSSDAASVYLGDVARIELAEQDPSVVSTFNGQPATGFGVNLQTGANAVETSERVHAALEKVAGTLPTGVEIVFPYDTTPFVEASIEQVYHTLFEAIVLVFVVILAFLQSWRATIIPTLAVPVVLLGTFGVLAIAGLSINTLTMFALVLAIGLLVDDAIVVVENVERVMEEEGLGPVEATEKSMREISGALVGIVVVLSAVFLPMAFMSGSTGIIYRQFSITIISAMILSLLVALTLTPAMCAQILKRPTHGAKIWPARKFNQGLDRLNRGYIGTVTRLIRRPFRMLALVAAVGVAISSVYGKLPSSFVPTEDQGMLMAMVTLPQPATQGQTREAVQAMETYLNDEFGDAITSTFSAIGFSFSGSGQNAAMMFVALSDSDKRPGITAGDIADAANGHFANSALGQIFFLQPPAIQGMGVSSGFQMYLVDQANGGSEALRTAVDTLVAKANDSGAATSLRGNDANSETSLDVNLDAARLQALGLSVSDVNTMLTTIFAGNYVNDFTLNGKLREVIVMGQAEDRMQPKDLHRWYTRNDSDVMVPLAAFSELSYGEVRTSVTRYGGVDAFELQGAPGAGLSSGEAMEAMETLTAEMPGGYGVAWTGLSYQERMSGNQEPLLYTLSAVIVFLCLAALYESWTVPFSVMLAVPVGLLGALLTAKLFGQSNDVYFKVGMLTTIGLAARNAILIVEFAQALRAEGQGLKDAIVTAAKQRLRPILMTTIAFMLGILPLAIASGAGANAQNSIGIGMLGGIAFSACFGILMVPALYVAVMEGTARLSGIFAKKAKP